MLRSVSRAIRVLTPEGSVLLRGCRASRGLRTVSRSHVPRSRAAVVYTKREQHENDVCIEARRELEGEHALEAYPIRGVTFENRQELLQCVQQRQAVLFEREPWNPHDSNAVQINTLGGDTLGYVPRDFTYEFEHGFSTGLVASVGYGPTGALGAVVHVRPALPALTLPVLPTALTAYAEASMLSAHVPDWARIETTAHSLAGGACAVSGVLESSLVLLPQWRLNWQRRQVTLLGLCAVCTPVAHASMQAQSKRKKDRERALRVISHINCWDETECDRYMEQVKHVQSLCDDITDWKLDLSWLQRSGLLGTPPPAPPLP